MLNKRMVLVLVSLVMLLTFSTFTASARGRVDVDTVSSLALSYSYEGQAFSGLNIRIYRVAEISSDSVFGLTGAFADYPVEVNYLKTQDEWKQVASTMDAYVVSDGIEPDQTAVTGEDGTVHFTELPAGLYFVESVRAEYDKGYCDFTGFMISVPNVDVNDEWVYDVVATPKSLYVEVEPEDITYTVNKLWKDAGNEKERPQSVELGLYKDGTLVETVILSSENDWTYTWIAPDDGSVWHAVERNISKGYTVTLEQQGNAFFVTNTYIEEPDIPITGDTANLNLFMIVMTISGTVLLIVGVGSLRGKKR